jgi:lipopolysaccharide/colanic/teichoic acid biosynthesis glycosyltransferase
MWRTQKQLDRSLGASRTAFWLPVIDVTAMGVALIFAMYIRGGVDSAHLPIVLIYLTISSAAVVMLFHGARLYDVIPRYFGLHETQEIIKLLVLAMALGCFSAFIINRVVTIPRGSIVVHGLLAFCLMYAVRSVMRLRATRVSRKARWDDVVNVLVVGVNPGAALYIDAVRLLGRPIVRVAGVIAESSDVSARWISGQRILASVGELGETMVTLLNHGIHVHRLVVTVPSARLSPIVRQQLRDAAEAHGARIQHLHEILHIPTPRGGYVEAGDVTWSGDVYPILRRAGDILAAGLGLVLLSPVLLVTAVLVLIDVGPPVLFWQERPGRFGVPFRLYKFRTMAGPLDRSDRVVSEDKRTSAIGRFIRRFRLDELPQLGNVLVGSMSIVGPRPLLARDQPPNSERRLSVRPGITGWAQVHGGHAVSPEEKGGLDLWYTDHLSLFVDVKILILTLVSLVRGDRRAAFLAALALRDGVPAPARGARTFGRSGSSAGVAAMVKDGAVYSPPLD